MNSSKSAKLLAASGGDTVKLLDILSNGEKQCVLAYSPSPKFSVNSVKWNHNNMVLASAGDDGEISFWKKNGTRLGALSCGNVSGGNLEGVESISAINFCNKGSRYLCSGGDGKVVRIWDLQSKRCIKWLKGHSDTITSVMCNCKDEHIASVSRKGQVIIHNISSGAKAAELKDPDGQVLEALDYSRTSRHLLLTAGDEGSIHVWDTTGRSPKVSWSKQHSAPTTGACFSPSNDKIIASVGLDMKLYTYHTGSKKQTSCTHHEAPFSSLAYSDDGLTLVAGTATGQVVLYDVRRKPQPLRVVRVYGDSEAVSNVCWQRSNPVAFDESNCTDETVLLAGDAAEAFIMPDPLPSRLSSSSRAFDHVTSNLLVNPTLARLHPPKNNNNIKDDMEVFSPIVEVQPLTPSFDKLWDNPQPPAFVLPSRRFGENPISEQRSKQVGSPPSFPHPSSNLAPVRNYNANAAAPHKARAGERSLEKFIHRRQAMKMPTRFAKSTPPSSSSSLGLTLHGSQDPETSHQAATLDHAALSSERLSSYAERIGFTPVGSPKSKKTGSETREEILSGLFSNSQPSTPATSNGGETQLQETSLPQQGSCCNVQLFHHKHEETVASFHGDMQNLHLEILRQFHMQEMGMSSVLRLVLENQGEMMKEIQSLHEEIQHLHRLL